MPLFEKEALRQGFMVSAEAARAVGSPGQLPLPYYKCFYISLESMRKHSSEKRLTEEFQGHLVFYDTTVAVSALFEHLSQGRSIRSFIKRFPAVRKDQILQLLKKAESLIIGEFKN